MNLSFAATSSTPMEQLYRETIQVEPASMICRRFNARNLISVRNLGIGNFAVDLMRDEQGNKFAVKKMLITTEAGRRKQMKRDLAFMMRAGQDHHPNIIRFYGHQIIRYEVFIVMEVMHSCFYKLLQQCPDGIPEEIVGVACSSTVRALNHLKVNYNMIHRDVRPSNILVHEDGSIKLCDFGISRELVNSLASTQGVGNDLYLPPERLGTESIGIKYGIKSDVWALGITLVELATGKHPYADLNLFEAVLSIVKDDAPGLLQDRFTIPFQSFIARCLDKDTSRRADYGALMQLPFLTSQPAYGSQIVSSWLKLNNLS